jgi:hypothetical protein
MGRLLVKVKKVIAHKNGMNTKEDFFIVFLPKL